MPADRRYGNNEQMALGFFFASIFFASISSSTMPSLIGLAQSPHP